MTTDPRARRLFRQIAGCAAVVLLAWCRPDCLPAQEAGEAAGGSGNVVVTQPFPWGGLFVVVFLMGLCLFAVCRSSRRN